MFFRRGGRSENESIDCPKLNYVIVKWCGQKQSRDREEAAGKTGFKQPNRRLLTELACGLKPTSRLGFTGLSHYSETKSGLSCGPR